MPFSHLIDLEAVLDQLSIHAAIFVGSSMGGALAIDFAIEHPERTIALAADRHLDQRRRGCRGSRGGEPTSRTRTNNAIDRGNFDSANKILAHLWLDGPLSEAGRVSGPVRELFLAMDAIQLNHPKLTQEEEPEPAIDAVGNIIAPTLLVVGELDFPDIVDRHEDLSEEIENAFAIVLEDTAHFPSLERPGPVQPDPARIPRGGDGAGRGRRGQRRRA